MAAVMVQSGLDVGSLALVVEVQQPVQDFLPRSWPDPAPGLAP